MAAKGIGGPGGRGKGSGAGKGAKGGGKSRPGPRQPASMKSGGSRPGTKPGAKTGGKTGPKDGFKPGQKGTSGKAGKRPPARAGADRPWEKRPRTEGPARRARPDAAQAMPGTGPDTASGRVAGLNPVIELLRSGGRQVDAVYVDKDKGGGRFDELIKLARNSGITVKYVPRDALDKLSGVERHQGAIAIVSPKEYADPDAVVARALSGGRLPLIVILDGVEDPHNLGSVIRTAESVGAHGVVIPEHRAAHLSASVAKVSAGALEHMPVAKVTNLAGFLADLKEKGFWIAGLEGTAEKEYTTFDMNVPLAVVLGSEGGGIRPLVKKACDALLRVPMLGKVGSLNVSVAAGVMLYEVVRQRQIKP